MGDQGGRRRPGPSRISHAGLSAPLGQSVAIEELRTVRAVGRTTKQRIRVGVLGAALALAGVPLTGAAAAVTTVTCDGEGDIAAVQAAVDAAVDGETIALSGRCDFSDARPHGGSLASIDSTAVLIRPGAPVQDLTITSADGPQSTSVVGSGTQTAFTIAPGNDGVTITGLQLVSFARPIVVAGAARATIGSTSPGATPSPTGNRILGGATMNSAILAVANSAPMSVTYGATGAAGSATLNAANLDDLSVRGNYVSYAPPGIGSATGDAAVVAIDVRQAGTGLIDDVTIAENAVGMFTSDFASTHQNAVRVQGLAAVPSGAVPALTDYRITDVTVAGNNLGRLEELDPVAAGDINSGDVHAAGRVGILLERVGGFTVDGNRVRSRLSTSLVPAPGGGIVASDSSFGAITGNRVVVGADPGTTSADLGGVAVVDGLAKILGDPAADQGTTDVRVVGNQLGVAEAGAVGVQRGLVVAGADLVSLHDNTVAMSGDDALILGPTVTATGGDLPRRVTRVVACSNMLDGAADSTSEVTFASATPPSTGNALPGGALVANNSECTPTAQLAPNPVGAGQSLFVGGRAWAGRTVTADVTDKNGATLSKAGTADALGAYSIEFTTAELGSLADGPLSGVLSASDADGFSIAAAEAAGTLNAVIDSPLAGTVSLLDNPPGGTDGYTNDGDIAVGVRAGWTAPADPDVVKAKVWFSTPTATIPPGCGPFTVQPAQTGLLNGTCGHNLPQGTYFFNVQWQANDGELSPVISASSIKDTVRVVPVITDPADGAIVPTTSVTVSGTAEPDAAITLREGRTSNLGTLGTTTADANGDWAVTVSLEERTYDLNAFAVDVAGNRTAASQVIQITVNTGPPDTTPPAPPVITTPLDGASLPAAQQWRGTTEPLARVHLVLNGVAFKELRADLGGNWSTTTYLSPSASYTITARATDGSGNVSADSAPVTILVDAVKPGVTISTPPDTVFILNAFDRVIEGTATDNDKVGFVQVQFYDELQKRLGNPYEATCTGCGTASATWEVDVPGNLVPGFYYAQAFAHDAAGNSTATPLMRFIVVP